MKPLTGLIPAKQRALVYGVLSLMLTLYGIWQATKGNWEQFAVSVATAGATELARANVDTTDADEPDADG